MGSQLQLYCGLVHSFFHPPLYFPIFNSQLSHLTCSLKINLAIIVPISQMQVLFWQIIFLSYHMDASTLKLFNLFFLKNSCFIKKKTKSFKYAYNILHTNVIIQMSLNKYFDASHQQLTQHKDSTSPVKTEDNFTIYLRVKPILVDPSQTQSLHVLNSHEVELLPPYFSTDSERIFRYSEVFNQKADNLEVFNKTMILPIKNVLSGYNSTVFIYGMTGAGKTHTMFDHIQIQEQPQRQGLVGLALAKIFEDIKKEKIGKFQIGVSFYEIYNQNIRDLLSEGAQSLNIMEDPLKGVIINELVQLQVQTPLQAKKAVHQGMNRRAMNATKNNEVSSRSHAILQFTIRRYTPKKTPGEVELRQSKLFLIDLAGNEKACHGQNKRFMEGVNINKSLLTLGKCISILAEQKKSAFIPFRDSKLTRILKDSLGGNSKTVMIACVSCENRFYQQTLNTLKYSSKAKRIKNSNTGGIVKMVSDRQMPMEAVNDIKLGGDVYITNFVTALQHLLKQKLKISNMREQLTECYQLNEKQAKTNASEVFTNNMKEICNILLKLSDRQRQIDTKLQEFINKFNSDAQKKKDGVYQQLKEYQFIIEKQTIQIEKLKNQQRIKDQQSQEGSSSIIEMSQSRPRLQLKPSFNSQDHFLQRSIETPSCPSHKNSFILIHENSGHSENKFKNTVSINLASCKNANNKQNIMMNSSKRSDSSKSLALSLVKKTDRVVSKKRTQPTIDLSVQLIKLKSPQMRESFNNKPSLSSNISEINKQRDFVGRLKDMEKNSNKYSKLVIGELLAQYDEYHYEISKMEHSMLNKLRFMFKNRELQSVSNIQTQDKSIGRLY